MASLHHSPSQNASGVQKICLQASKLCVCASELLSWARKKKIHRKQEKWAAGTTVVGATLDRQLFTVP